MGAEWYAIANAAEVSSPAVLVYPDRIEQNIRRMIAIAGGPERLRPHVKTHKLAEVVQMHLAAGVSKFKCATIAEAEMTAQAGAADVLLAFQPVGPTADRLLALARKFPKTRFGTICDDLAVLDHLNRAFQSAPQRLRVYLDIDCGMGRTGIRPGDSAFDLYRRLRASPALEAAGLHVYDGHIHDAELASREKQCAEAFGPAEEFRTRLEAAGLPVPAMVSGGTPTFGIQARFPDRECSPGTYVFWDFGYQGKYPDLDFLVAAVLLGRVVSKPGTNRLCVDLGHKSVAAENPQPRVQFLNLPEAVPVMHSEEHLVVETLRAAEFPVGSVLYAVPRHVCPTIALHDTVQVVRDGRVAGQWRVTARNRSISV